jgi:predicted SprT family Zn-dependent metalloprotease
MLSTMDKNRKAIQHEIATLVFYMQGGIGFDEAHMLSADQRLMMSKVVEKHYSAMNPKGKSNLL